MREIFVSALIGFLIISNLIGVCKIRELQCKMEKERNPSFEQAKGRFYSQLIGYDWDIYKRTPDIQYYSTMKQAINHSQKISANGGVEVVTRGRAEESFLVMLWEAENPGIGIEAKTSLLAEGVVCLDASLKPGTYIICIIYRQTSLFFAFELQITE